MKNNNVKVVTINGEELVVTSSRDVANDFGKRHDHVKRDIENLIKNMVDDEKEVKKSDSPKLGNEFFINSTYVSRGKNCEEYLLTRDGFSLLVMGFTGKEALHWKLKYIEDFNEMERQLREVKEVVDSKGSITKEEFYEIHFGNAKRIRMSFETTTEFKELFDNFLEYVGRMDVATRVKRCEHLQKVLDDIMNERVRDLTISLSEVFVLRSELTDMKLKLEELINETLNRSYGQQIRRAKEATK